MNNTLLKALGFDDQDPQVINAQKDARSLSDTILQLVRRRKHLGIKQKALAEKMGTSQSTVSEFERLGGNPTMFTLQRYARAVDAELVVKIKARNATYHETQGWVDFKVLIGDIPPRRHVSVRNEPWRSEQLSGIVVRSA